MKYLEIPEIRVLRGKKAAKALYDFIGELERQGCPELTEKQTDTLIKFAKGLISSIEAENQGAISDKNIKEKHFATFAHSHSQPPVTAFPHPCGVQKLI